MKTVAVLIAFLSVTAFADDEKVLKSKIQKVTVYQQGAQIKQQATYSLTKGIHTLIIEGVSPSIDPNSLQVQGTGNIVLLESKYSVFYPLPDPVVINPNTIPAEILREINFLNDSIADLDFEIAENNYKIDVLLSEKAIIANNGTIKGVGKVNDSIPLLKEAILYYHIKMNEINKELLMYERKRLMQSKTKNRMQNRLATLANYNVNNSFQQPGPKPPVHRIEVMLSAVEATTGKLDITYLTANAGWIPLYDFRSSGSKSTVDLTYKGMVYQNTGIDWEDVKLSLSTNNPYVNRIKPTLNPWYLDFYTYIYNEDERAKRAYGGGIDNNSPATTESADKDSDDFLAKTSADFTTMIEQLLSVEYSIDLPYNIKSDGKHNMVLVDNKSLETEFLYYSIPKLDLSVYLVARLSDLGKLNLIPGKANLFHDGAYLGETWIDPRTMSDTLDLSLGKDSKFNISRTLLKNESKEKVVGDKVLKTFAYQIELKNHHDKSISLILQDQIPVVRNSEIEVEVLNVSKGIVNDISGIVTWNLKLKPLESATFSLTYTVKYDKTKQINLAYN